MGNHTTQNRFSTKREISSSNWIYGILSEPVINHITTEGTGQQTRQLSVDSLVTNENGTPDNKGKLKIGSKYKFSGRNLLYCKSV